MKKKMVRFCIIFITAMCIICAGNSIFGVGEVQAANVKLSVTEKTIQKNESFKLTLKNYKGKASIKWKTSNKNVAAIKKISKMKYKVTGKKAGKATITVKVGKKKYKCTVTVGSDEASSDSAEEYVEAKMEIPHVGASNSYAKIVITNNTKNDITVQGVASFNGYSCRRLTASSVGDAYVLAPGYYVTLTYYRAILWSYAFDEKYCDMYLDNESTGWVMVSSNDKSYKVEFDAKGTETIIN